MDKLQTKILSRLLDKYETSKSFSGENKVNQSFSDTIVHLFPRYKDDAEYDYFCEVNNALRELESRNLVIVKWQKNGVAVKVSLCMEHKDECYTLLKRQPRQDEQKNLKEVLAHYLKPQLGKNTILHDYAKAQMARLQKNKPVEYYAGNITEYADLLKFAESILNNEDEIFIRDFSIQLFGDSKRAEMLKSKAQSLLYQYGDFEEKESVCEECGIVSTPTYVCMKGNAQLEIAGQVLNLSGIKGDIALSTTSLKELQKIRVVGERVVTVENLTSFHDYSNGDDFVIYLGGFHNRVKCRFLQFLFQQNPEKKYSHFGDIDAGGFYILEHLKHKTGILFSPMYMDRTVLEEHRECCKPLTENDRKRLQQLLDTYTNRAKGKNATESRADQEMNDSRKNTETINYMLEQGCKLEQEAVKLPKVYIHT